VLALARKQENGLAANVDDSQKKTAAPQRCPGGQLHIYLQVGHLQLLAVLLVLSRRKFGTAAACDKIGEFKQGQGNRNFEEATL
jgi:hypothetical protein